MNYQIVTQKNISILTLAGDISKEDKDSLAGSISELLSAQSDSVIIYFKNVASIEVAVHRELTMLQHEVRQKKKLSIIGLNNQMKSYLTEKGVIRSHEFSQELHDRLRITTCD